MLHGGQVGLLQGCGISVHSLGFVALYNHSPPSAEGGLALTGERWCLHYGTQTLNGGQGAPSCGDAHGGEAYGTGLSEVTLQWKPATEYIGIFAPDSHDGAVVLPGR